MSVCKRTLAALVVLVGAQTGASATAASDARLTNLRAEPHHGVKVFHGQPVSRGSVPVMLRPQGKRCTSGSKRLAESYARAKLLDPIFDAIFALSPQVEIKIKNGLIYNSIDLLRRLEHPSTGGRPVPSWRDVDIELFAPAGISRDVIRDTIIERSVEVGLEPIVRREKHHPVVPNGGNAAEAEQHLQVLLPCQGSCVQLDMSIYPSAEAMHGVKAWLDWRYLKLALHRDEAFHEQIARLVHVHSVESARKLANLEHPEYVQAVLDGFPHLTPNGISNDRRAEAPMLLLYLLGKPGFGYIPLEHGRNQLYATGILGPHQNTMLREFFGPQSVSQDGTPIAVADDPLRHRRTAYWLSSFRLRGTSEPRRMDRVLEAVKDWHLIDMFPGMGEVVYDKRAWSDTRQAVEALYSQAYRQWQSIVKDKPCGVAQCSDGRDRVFGGMFAALKTESQLWAALEPFAGGLPLNQDEPVLGHHSSLKGIEAGWVAARELLGYR